MILKVQNVGWIFGWVACFIAFISVFFPSWKIFLSNLDISSTLARHLAIYRALKLFLIAISTDSRQLGGSIGKVPGPSIASRQLMDRLSFCYCVFAFFLDTFSIAAFVDVVFIDTFLDKWLDTSICQELLRYKGQAWSGSYFSQSLSQQKCLFTSQTSLTHSKSFSQVIFKLFQVLSSLGMFLFSHLHAFSCFET